MPEVKPPIAPARALNWESEARAAHSSKADAGFMVVDEETTVEGDGGMMMREVEGGCPYSAGEGAVVFSSSDIPLPQQGGGGSSVRWIEDGSCLNSSMGTAGTLQGITHGTGTRDYGDQCWANATCQGRRSCQSLELLESLSWW